MLESSACLSTSMFMIVIQENVENWAYIALINTLKKEDMLMLGYP